MHLPRYIEWYLICFLILSTLGFIPVWIVEALENTDDSPSATIVAIGRGMNWVVVVSGAYAFASVEGITMIAEIFLKRREERGREKGREEERLRIVSRLAGKTPDEQAEEIKKLIEETDADKRG